MDLRESNWFLTAELEVQSQMTVCDIYGGQNCAGTTSSQSFLFGGGDSLLIIFPTLHYARHYLSVP
jgi:hypothetical protein